MVGSSLLDHDSFIHIALFYRSVREYLDELVPFVVDGVAGGDAVLVAVPEPNLSLLRTALGDTAGMVTLVDMSRAGRNPGHILGGVMGSFAEGHPTRPPRMIGESVWDGRSELEYPACVQHEALINQAFDGRDGATICPYDATRLPPGVLLDAEVTHPRLRSAGQTDKPSPGFSPDRIWARNNEPLPGNPTAATYALNRLADLAGARAFAARYAQWFGLSGADIADLQMIVNELATNSLQHARGACTLFLWAADGQLICQVSDSGQLADPMAGRRPINGHDAHGRGLFVVNAIADLVRVYTTASGTTVQAYLRMKEQT